MFTRIVGGLDAVTGHLLGVLGAGQHLTAELSTEVTVAQQLLIYPGNDCDRTIPSRKATVRPVAMG